MSFSRLLSRPAGFVFIALVAALGACSGASSDDASTSAASGAVGSAAVVAMHVDVAPKPEGALADVSIGDRESPVTFIEYGSYTCGGCGSFHANVYPQLKERYIDTGKIRFVFREFPTAPVDRSAAASMLARCAAEKNGSEAYFLVHDALFESQRVWAVAPSWREELLKIAAQARIDEAAFKECTQREDLRDLINANVTAAQKHFDVTGTPSFVLNGEKRSFRTVDDLFAAIDAEIEKTAQ